MAAQNGGIRKKSVFIKLGALLPPKGNVAPFEGHIQALSAALSSFKQKEDAGLATVYLVAGQERAKAMDKVSGLGIGNYISEANMFFVTPEYMQSKEEVDRERHLAHLEKDPDFVDEYFTQRTILDLIASGSVQRDEAVLIGNDIWFDGFYTSRFSGIDFVLMGERLTERNMPVGQLRGINYISLTQQDMAKVLVWDFPPTNTSALQNYIMDKLSRELLKDTDFSGLVNKVGQRRENN